MTDTPDMDIPLPEPIMAPLNAIAQEAADNGNSMKNGAWLPKKLSEIQDAIRAHVAAEVAKERENLRAAIMAKHEAANGQHNLYHCLVVELLGDEAIRAAAPPQCTSAPSELQ